MESWYFGLTGVLAVALATDLRSRKIYNWLTFPAMLAGLVLNVALGGWLGLGSSLIGFVVGTIIFLLGFMLGNGAMGAGDVKLMAAVGLWLGWPATLAAVVYVTVIGAVIALLYAAVNGALLQMLKNVYWFMVALVVPGGRPDAAFAQSATKPLPYGVSIVLGTTLALFYPQVSDLAHALGLS